MNVVKDRYGKSYRCMHANMPMWLFVRSNCIYIYIDTSFFSLIFLWKKEIKKGTFTCEHEMNEDTGTQEKTKEKFKSVRYETIMALK